MNWTNNVLHVGDKDGGVEFRVVSKGFDETAYSWHAEIWIAGREIGVAEECALPADRARRAAEEIASAIFKGEEVWRAKWTHPFSEDYFTYYDKKSFAELPPDFFNDAEVQRGTWCRWRESDGMPAR